MPHSATSEERLHTIDQQLARLDGQAPSANAAIDKHKKMAANPFRFLRGAAQLFYTDIASGQLPLPTTLTEQVPMTTVMGDCHVANFGFLTEEGSAGDTVIFSPNDFDDACYGPAVWDLVRFAVSLVLAAEYAQGLLSGHYQSSELDTLDNQIAATHAEAEQAIHNFLSSYLNRCQQLLTTPDKRHQSLQGFNKGHVLHKLELKARRRAAGGEDFLLKSSLAKAVDLNQKPLRFQQRAERFRRLPEAEQQQVQRAFRPYVDDHIHDAVERLDAGTGSVNMRRYYLLVGPQTLHQTDELNLCHVVEVKQQRQAAPLYEFPHLSPINQLNPAHLTAACQRRMQRRADILLDEVIWRGSHWLVRSRHHARVGVDPEQIALAKQAPGKRLNQYAKACGKALALAHSRGDRRSTRFEQALTSLLPSQIDSLVQISLDYAEQSVQDHKLLQQLLASNAHNET